MKAKKSCVLTPAVALVLASIHLKGFDRMFISSGELSHNPTGLSIYSSGISRTGISNRDWDLELLNKQELETTTGIAI